MKMRFHSTPMVCLYTHIFGFGIGFGPIIKRKLCGEKKAENNKTKISEHGKLFVCLSKIPGTVCLGATALCAVRALAI